MLQMANPTSLKDTFRIAREFEESDFFNRNMTKPNENNTKTKYSNLKNYFDSFFGIIRGNAKKNLHFLIQ